MNCKNCKTNLSQDNDYCSKCGGKIIRNRLTLKQLFSHFAELYLNFDNKFLRTFIGLFKHPQQVIDGYISGTRKKYVDVISYFALAVTITGFEYFILRKFFPNFIDISNMTYKGSEAFMADYMNTVIEYQSLVLMLFVPLYALVGKFVFYNYKNYNYTEILVIFMYVIAQLSIAGAIILLTSAVFGLNMGVLSPVISIFQIVYSGYCLKRLYHLNKKSIILKTLLFFLIAFVTYIAIVILILVVLLIVGGPEYFIQMMETQNALSQ
ncbi:DUF3667 domain-containing protein [Lacinutrix undariae]